MITSSWSTQRTRAKDAEHMTRLSAQYDVNLEDITDRHDDDSDTGT